MRITTERLVLEPINMRHLEATHAYASDTENTRYMVRLPNENLLETAAFIQNAATEMKKRQPSVYEFAILREGEQVGGMSAFMLDDDTVEFGWILDRRHQGRGYAHEAARGLIAWARGELGIRRIIAQCDAENTASYRLMEKLGMRRISCTMGRKNRSSDEERSELTYELLL